jgi:hypothetical protein
MKPNLRVLFIANLSNLIGEYITFPTLWLDSISNRRINVIKKQTEYDKAEVWFKFAKRELDRSRELLDLRVISRRDYDESEKNLKESEKNFERAKENLRIVETQLVPYLSIDNEIPKNEKPALNLLLKEIWIYDVSTGTILLKRKV